jgi:cysteine synthase
MTKLGLDDKVANNEILEQTLKRFKEQNILIPTISELADPKTISAEIVEKLKDVDRNEPHPLNLYRINWYNDPNGTGFVELPQYVVLPKELTGVDAKIVVMLGKNFPMVDCHKVLAAFGCLAPRLVTGQFDPTKHRAIWPSTGNYCRGGVAVSRIMDCHGVGILPEEMSQERFNWLNKWCKDPEYDIIATPGCESNVKEIYDKCNELDKDPDNIIFNQFCEFGNTLIHYQCTGKALADVFEHLKSDNEELQLKTFVSATGSAGTLSGGDYLKDHYGADVAAVEALECPTLLYNGFGGHNIQGIGDKHVPYIHNAYNTDYVVAISDVNTDNVGVLFNTEVGKKYLVERKGLNKDFVEALGYFGLSSLCNIMAAIKVAKYNNYTENDVLMTVATDSAAMYQTEVELALEKFFNKSFDEVDAAEVYGRYLMGIGTDHMREMSLRDRDAIFNLGYYTWVEQQGVTVEEFNARKDPKYWSEMRKYLEIWDELIRSFNEKTGVKA